MGTVIRLASPGPIDFGPHARMRIRQRTAVYLDAADLGGVAPAAYRQREMLAALRTEPTPWWYVAEEDDPADGPRCFYPVPVPDLLGEDGEPLVALVMIARRDAHVIREPRPWFVVTVLTQSMVNDAIATGMWRRDPFDFPRTTSAAQPVLSAQHAGELMARAQDYAKKDRVEVCLGGSPLATDSKWSPGAVIEVYSRGLRVRLDDAPKGKAEIAVDFSRVRLVESAKEARAARVATVAAVPDKPPAPPPKVSPTLTLKPPAAVVPAALPETLDAAKSLVAELEAAVELAAAPMRKLVAQLEELRASRTRVDEDEQKEVAALDAEYAAKVAAARARADEKRGALEREIEAALRTRAKIEMLFATLRGEG